MPSGIVVSIQLISMIIFYDRILIVFAKRNVQEQQQQQQCSKGVQCDCKTIQVQQLIVVVRQAKWIKQRTHANCNGSVDSCWPIRSIHYKYMLLTNFVFAFCSGGARILFLLFSLYTFSSHLHHFLPSSNCNIFAIYVYIASHKRTNYKVSGGMVMLCILS